MKVLTGDEDCEPWHDAMAFHCRAQFGRWRLHGYERAASTAAISQVIATTSKIAAACHGTTGVASLTLEAGSATLK